jgi:hypothetical protein
MQNGGREYLDKRRGLGRQCWNGPCDTSPCVCPKSWKKIVKRKWRRKDKKIIAEQMGDVNL